MGRETQMISHYPIGKCEKKTFEFCYRAKGHFLTFVLFLFVFHSFQFYRLSIFIILCAQFFLMFRSSDQSESERQLHIKISQHFERNRRRINIALFLYKLFFGFFFHSSVRCSSIPIRTRSTNSQ